MIPKIKMLMVFLMAAPIFAVAQDSQKRSAHWACDNIDDGYSKTQCIAQMEEMAESPDWSATSFWETRFKEDPMTDKKTCYVKPTYYSKDNGGLTVLVTPSVIGFATLGNTYPGTSQKIRVDKNAPISLDGFATGKSSQALLSQLTNGKAVLTEFRDWPYNLPRHRKLPVCDLLQKIEECKESIK